MSRRGDVVIVDFPFADTGDSKVRPAVVVQNDRDNKRFRKTVIAMITGNLRRKSQAIFSSTQMPRREHPGA